MNKHGPAYQVDTSDDMDTGLPAGCALIAGLMFWAVLVVLWFVTR